MQNISLDIQSLRQAYLAKTITPAQLVDYLLDKAAHYDDHNIWIYRLNREEIAPYLSALADQSPDTLPLYGIPFAIKDNIDLAGIPTTAGCDAFRYTPDSHAYVVGKLIEAGAIPLGKTNLDQFATGLVGVRSPWGACKNSFNSAYVSGGSSSGSAVAVAKGLVSFSLGTDTAGSGRVPAAFNNLIGWKPTRGLLSATGMVPACRTLDSISLFTLTADDVRTLYAVATAYDATDDYARPDTGANLTEGVNRQREEFVFGVPQPGQLKFFGNASAEHCFHESLAKLEAMGGKKVELDFAPFLAAAELLYQGPWVAERYVATEAITANQPDALLEVTRTIIAGAKNVSAIDAFKAEYKMQAYRQQAQVLLAQADMLVTPTAGTIYSIAQVEADPIQLNSNLGYYTNFMNLLDCAAVAVPAGFLENGLPFGITFFSGAFTDQRLLNLADQWQHQCNYALGAAGLPLPPITKPELPPVAPGNVRVVVCGAHLSGMPLNWQLTERHGFLVQTTTTSENYRFYALKGGPPYRPGLIRDIGNGQAIEVEVWELPSAQFGSFVTGIPAPLGIGKVELADGRWEASFICEPCGIEGARDITELGSWRRFKPEE